MHVLLVEDDRRLAPLLARLLTEEHHVVEVVTSGEEGLAMAVEGIDVVILDVGLPDMSGLDVARRLRRRRSTMPILMLTARDSVEDRVDGLDAGADDYLVKPFAFAEVAARLRALTRRPVAAPELLLSCGPITIDESHHDIRVAGAQIELSPREYALLECLVRHPDQVLNRDQLMDHAWPFGVAVTPNSVDAYVKLLRRKLGPRGARHLETVRGIGYRLAREVGGPDA
jgi:two-component system, OmpR family, response regulator